jgi:hypothetical protein
MVVAGALALPRGAALCLALELLTRLWAVDLVQPVAMQTSTRRSTIPRRSKLLYSAAFCSLWATQIHIAPGRSENIPSMQLADWFKAVRIDTFRMYQPSVLLPRAMQGSIFPWLCAGIAKA